MSLLAIIPAKKHSTRLAGKNMMQINGESLVERALATAVKSAIFNNIVLAVDSTEIAHATSARDFGKRIIIHYRSRALSEDGVESAAVVLSVLMEKGRLCDYDSFCLLNPTSPCRTVEMLQRAHNEFKSKDLDCFWSMGKYGNHDGNFLFWKTIPFLRYISRSIIDGPHWARTDGIDINTQKDFDLAVKTLSDRR